MKCQIPQISWHNRDPILSVDFQLKSKIEGENNVYRLATASTDNHIFIWHVKFTESGQVTLDFVSDLNRHTNSVNVVRFSKQSNEFIASADCEATIIIWKQHDREMYDADPSSECLNKEFWVQSKILRGHLDDICDLSWSYDGNFLISGSVDNSAILWDVNKGKNVGLLGDAKGFVQGVTWDPLNQYVATLSSDRCLRIYNPTSKRVLFKAHKTMLPIKEGETAKSSKIFHDNTMKSFCRRLVFSPDGNFLICPSGIVEQDEGNSMNTIYIFSRTCLTKPLVYFPIGKKCAIAVSCCPILFELRKKQPLTDATKRKPNMFQLPYRIIFAVATQDSIIFFDTQQTKPFAHVSKIHYCALSDISWSADGKMLIVSSVDGYCSFISFETNELGIVYGQNKVEEGSAMKIAAEQKTEAMEEGSAKKIAAEQKTDAKLILEPETEWKLVLEPESVISDQPDMKNKLDQNQENVFKGIGSTSQNVSNNNNFTNQIIPTKNTDTPTINTKIQSSAIEIIKNNSEPKKQGRRVSLITLSKKE